MTSTDWESVQNRYVDIRGVEGIEKRRRYYSPYFLRFGSDVVIEAGCFFAHPERIILEDDARFNVDCIVYGSGGVRIGRHARIGPRVIIHSANHQVGTTDPKAFFELGYDYLPVWIGDNVLVSANVSVLPGTILGNGSFVAAAAVLPANSYPTGSFLVGVPAEHLRSRDELVSSNTWAPAPEIAFVVSRATPDWRPAIEHLLTVLGLPQVAIIECHQPLPKSVRVAIRCPNATGPLEGLDVWDIVDGDRPLRGVENRISICQPATDMAVVVPDRTVTAFRPIANRHSELSLRARSVALLLMDRLTKRSNALRPAEFLDWVVSIAALGLQCGRPDRLLERLIDLLSRRMPRELSLSTESICTRGSHDVVSLWLKACLEPPVERPRSWNWKELLLRMARTRTRTVDYDLHSSRSGEGAQAPPLTWQHAGAVVVGEALQTKSAEQRDAVRAKLSRLVRCSKDSARLVSLGIAARLLGDEQVEAEVHQKLSRDEWWPDRGCLPRIVPGKSNLLLSPLLLAWLLVERRSNEQHLSVPIGLFDDELEERALSWRGIVSDSPEFAVIGTDAVLADTKKRLISSSLLTVWIELHHSQNREGHYQKLLDFAYNGAVAGLEAIWTRLLTTVLGQQSRPLVRLRPWPGRYKAALSLRYDVDRPVTTARAGEIIALQAMQMNAACASWYFRVGNGERAGLLRTLAASWQETGAHVEVIEDAVVAGKGVTHHSAPTSFYWQGDVSTQALETGQAMYGEFLANELPTPRPALLPNELSKGAYRVGAIMLASLHFPLEGGTIDDDTSYFDRHLDSFRRRLRSGGHAIIGSHPDLNQGLLEQVLKREHLDAIWLATVASVVDRVRTVMTPGAVRLGMENGVPKLLAEGTISDLQVEILESTKEPRTMVIQLKRGVPRDLPM